MLWNPASRTPLGVLSTDTNRFTEIFGLAFSNNGKLLASGGGSVVDVWDWRNGKLLRRFKSPFAFPVGDVAWSPNNRILAAWSEAAAGLWDVFSKKPPLRLQDHLYQGTDGWANVRALAWSPSGKSVATAMTGKVVLWDAATGKRRWILRDAGTIEKPGIDPHALAWNPHRFLLAMGRRGAVLLWEPNQHKNRTAIGWSVAMEMDRSGYGI